jgi:transcription elongation factor Elf1
MSIAIIRKSDIVREAPARWEQQYSHGNYGADKHEKTALLRSLPEGFTAEQVNEVIGNSSWTSNKCDECGQDHNFLVRIGEEPDYDARWVDVCLECIGNAVKALGSVQ